MNPELYDDLFTQALDTFMTKQEPELALLMVEQCLDILPNDTQAWVLKADIYFSMGRDWEASRCYIQAARSLTRRK